MKEGRIEMTMMGGIGVSGDGRGEGRKGLTPSQDPLLEKEGIRPGSLNDDARGGSEGISTFYYHIWLIGSTLPWANRAQQGSSRYREPAGNEKGKLLTSSAQDQSG